MKKLVGAAVALIILVVAGGAVFLANWEIPPPSQSVEKAIPNDRFPR